MQASEYADHFLAIGQKSYGKTVNDLYSNNGYIRNTLMFLRSWTDIEL